MTRLEVPHVPGAFLLTDILTQAECRAILGAAEAVGFRPDQPAGEKEGASVLAHNLYWLADPGFIKTFTDRFLHLVPQSIDGGEVTGINARFRGELSLSFTERLIADAERAAQSTATFLEQSTDLTSTVLGLRVESIRSL